MSSPINTVPIQQFIQQVKSADLSQQREIKLDIKTAKQLSFCLSELSLKLLQDQDILLSRLQQSTGTGDLTVKMDGGGFSDN